MRSPLVTFVLASIVNHGQLLPKQMVRRVGSVGKTNPFLKLGDFVDTLCEQALLGVTRNPLPTGTICSMQSWRLTAGSAAELAANFGAFGITVPTRIEKKDQFAEEAYCLRRYLFPLAHSGLLEFPIEIVKHETPDFVFTSRGGNGIGLEVTKATREEFEADLTRFHRQQETRNYVSDLESGTMLSQRTRLGR
jgi:hypothetical protein